MNERNLMLDRKMNNAIEYLAVTLKTSGHNDKPVLIHSIRVGMLLYELGYSEEIVISGILHDILEDTKLSAKNLQNEWGHEITHIVSVNTFDPLMENKTEQFKEMFKRCEAYGPSAMIVKAADLLDNSHYIQFACDKTKQKWLLDKMRYFIEISFECLQTEEIYIKLNDQYQHLLCELMG